VKSGRGGPFREKEQRRNISELVSKTANTTTEGGERGGLKEDREERGSRINRGRFGQQKKGDGGKKGVPMTRGGGRPREVTETRGGAQRARNNLAREPGHA